MITKPVSSIFAGKQDKGIGFYVVLILLAGFMLIIAGKVFAGQEQDVQTMPVRAICNIKGHGKDGQVQWKNLVIYNSALDLKNTSEYIEDIFLEHHVTKAEGDCKEFVEGKTLLISFKAEVQ